MKRFLRCQSTRSFKSWFTGSSMQLPSWLFWYCLGVNSIFKWHEFPQQKGATHCTLVNVQQHPCITAVIQRVGCAHAQNTQVVPLVWIWTGSSHSHTYFPVSSLLSANSQQQQQKNTLEISYKLQSSVPNNHISRIAKKKTCNYNSNCGKRSFETRLVSALFFRVGKLAVLM